jgi:hypothetical protein
VIGDTDNLLEGFIMDLTPSASLDLGFECELRRLSSLKHSGCKVVADSLEVGTVGAGIMFACTIEQVRDAFSSGVLRSLC